MRTALEQFALIAHGVALADYLQNRTVFDESILMLSVHAKKPVPAPNVASSEVTIKETVAENQDSSP